MKLNLVLVGAAAAAVVDTANQLSVSLATEPSGVLSLPNEVPYTFEFVFENNLKEPAVLLNPIASFRKKGGSFKSVISNLTDTAELGTVAAHQKSVISYTRVFSQATKEMDLVFSFEADFGGVKKTVSTLPVRVRPTDPSPSFVKLSASVVVVLAVLLAILLFANEITNMVPLKVPKKKEERAAGEPGKPEDWIPSRLRGGKI